MTFRATAPARASARCPITFRDRRVGQSEDVAADRRRGARRRRPAPRRGAARPDRAGVAPRRDRARRPEPLGSAPEPTPAGRRARRPRRAAAPGARPGAAHRGLPRRAARALRRRPARRANRSRSCCAVRPRRPDRRRFDAPRGRRPAPRCRRRGSCARRRSPSIRSCSAAPRSAPPGGRTGAAPPARVYHAAGAGPLPIASGLPLVVTLLDLAPWELPEAFQRARRRAVRAAAAGPAPARRRGGHRRAPRRSPGGAPAAPPPARPAPGRRRSRRARRSRAGPAAAARPAPARRSRRRARRASGCPSATSSTPGRYDARQDLRDAARGARASSADAGRPDGARRGRRRGRRASCSSARRPDDRAALARAAARAGRRRRARVRAAADAEAGWPPSSAGPRGAILPVVSDAAGLAAIEAIACRRRRSSPRRSGRCPRLVGAAGILVEPRDPDRLAVALATVWADDRVHDRSRRPRASAPRARRRTWADVARETRGRLRRGRHPRRLTDRPAQRVVGVGVGAGVGDGAPTALGGGTLPSLMTTREPFGMTWTNVWPIVSVTGLPLGRRSASAP